MRKTPVTLVVGFALGAFAWAADSTLQLAPTSLNLMPAPQRISLQSGKFRLAESFAVSIAGIRETRLDKAIQRFLLWTEGRTGLVFSREVASGDQGLLIIQCEKTAGVIPRLGEDESYELEVSAARVILRCPTTTGALPGLETLSQLLTYDPDGYYFPAIDIADKPRFPWRGLLIDCGRHWLPFEVLKRNLDGMAAVKLNVLHLHLSDDQGFRIESRRFPRLQEKGSDGLYYSQQQIHELISYAADRGIRVVPEFDMPGHTASWLPGYPELASAPGPHEIIRTFGAQSVALDPTRETTYQFLDGFLGEMAELFPDPYLHIGGDEVNGKQWDANPGIQSFRREKGISSNVALQTYFNQRLSGILAKRGKIMVGWDEILQPGLPHDAVIQSWRGAASLADAARRAYSAILSSGYYLDSMATAGEYYAVDPAPANNGLSPVETARILGGEACAWGEFVSPDTIDSRIWPRLAAIAERLWSPQETNDVPDMYRRLSAVSTRLEGVGLKHHCNEDRMLGLLFGGGDLSALKTALGAVTPVARDDWDLRQEAPLTGLSDAATPDPELATDFTHLVGGLVKDAPNPKSNRESIARLLAAWQVAAPHATELSRSNPRTIQESRLFQDLSEAARIGMEAMQYLSRGARPSPGWRAEQLAALDRAAQPRAHLRIAILPAVRELVVLASEPAKARTVSFK